MAYRHVVLFRVRDDVPDDAVDEALRRLDALGQAPGVLEWTVRLSDDTRKGRVIVENALLGGREVLESFRAHPLHEQSSEVMREIADWWVADYEEPDPA